MTTKLFPWFQRKFTFEFPTETYACLLMRLRGTPSRLEEVVAGVKPHLLIARPGDTWSIQENAGHLLDLEPLWEARVRDYTEDKEELTPADLTNTKTHKAEHNEANTRAILEEFRNTRLAWLDPLSSFEINHFGKTRNHPRLKTPMRLVDLLYFVAEHDDHHLARIFELAR